MGRLGGLAMEWARTDRNRGFIASWPQFGAPAGFFLANLAVLVFSWLSGDRFLVWGWRIPFLISIVMVGVGLWIRLGILETPVFQKVLDEERVERVPVLQVLKRQPKEVALTAMLRLPEQAPGYIFGAFIFTYGTTVLGASRNFLLIGVLVSAVLGFLWVTVAGRRFVGPADYDDVRSRGGADRGKLLPSAPLQRLLARLPARLDHRGGSLAVYRDCAVRRLHFEFAYRSLHPRLCRHRHCRDSAARRSYQQGHLCRIRKGLSLPA